MAAQQEYHVVEICRSDGCDTGPGYWPSEQPKKKAAKDVVEKPVRAKPQMLRLEADDPRLLEWKVKMGILLKQELSLNPNGLPWVVEFPRGYWLYEKSKSLWVSGYPIKAKLFRTPQEFGLHLLWLLSNSENREDCCCQFCRVPSPESGGAAADDGLIITKSRMAEVSKPRAVSAKSMPTTASVSTQATTVPSQPAAPASTPSAPASTPSAPASIPSAPAAPAAPAVVPTIPRPVAQAGPGEAPQSNTTNTTPAPQQRGQPSPSLLFRTGELVWYTNGSSWRLGLILQSSNTTHQVIPIGYGESRQPAVLKQHTELRPFHAFTVPPPTRKDLQGRDYDGIPWKALLEVAATEQQQQSLGILLLDASKLGALKIDRSFSLFTPLTQKETAVSYYGAFLGAERVEIGDVLRLAQTAKFPGVTNVYLGLRGIIAQQNMVVYRGTAYRLLQGADATAAPATPNSVPPEAALPRALREELSWRSGVVPGLPIRWDILQADLIVKESEIKGRFYPTPRLAPILDPAGFGQAVKQAAETAATEGPEGGARVLSAVSPKLNGRLDAVAGSARYIGRKLNRRDAAGAMIPHGPQAVKFVFEASVREEMPGGPASAPGETHGGAV